MLYLCAAVVCNSALEMPSLRLLIWIPVGCAAVTEVCMYFLSVGFVLLPLIEGGYSSVVFVWSI